MIAPRAAAAIVLHAIACMPLEAAELPSQDRSVTACAERRFRQLARDGKLELDPVMGHGKDYDRALAECGVDPLRFNVEPPDPEAEERR